jgi:hypothetical protein
MTPRLEEVEEKLKGIRCRWCRSSDVAVLLRCDLGTVECLNVVKCRECGYLSELEPRELRFEPRTEEP